MHRFDVPTHAATVRRLRECVENHRRVMALDVEFRTDGAGEPLAAVLEELADVEAEIAAQGDDVQARMLKRADYQRVQQRIGSRMADAAASRREPPQHLVHVQRFDMTGRRVAEGQTSPPTSGVWTQGMRGMARRKRT